MSLLSIGTSPWQSSNSSPGRGEVVICSVSQTCHDAPRLRPNKSACRCLTFIYDTSVGESAEKYRADNHICIEP